MHIYDIAYIIFMIMNRVNFFDLNNLTYIYIDSAKKSPTAIIMNRPHALISQMRYVSLISKNANFFGHFEKPYLTKKNKNENITHENLRITVKPFQLCCCNMNVEFILQKPAFYTLFE